MYQDTAYMEIPSTLRALLQIQKATFLVQVEIHPLKALLPFIIQEINKTEKSTQIMGSVVVRSAAALSFAPPVRLVQVRLPNSEPEHV